ncbi:MAG: dual specificity protein phosphatase family protein [bacterium]|nr:dual specificity protein phosphatase family protein [bacterium]
MYKLYWITSHLATGHAPMSYEDLDQIRAQGISAIINLCGEFCDLHEIEETSGFDVFYLPIADECAPDKEAMEKGLDWLDEAIYLNKKVLVHCRMGHGRTGTFIAAYLLRRGFDFKGAQKTMKGRNANPATYAQRRFLKQYGKEEGALKTALPRIENRRHESEDARILAEFDQVVQRFDKVILGKALPADTIPEPACCLWPFYLQLIESMHLNEALNRLLRLQKRQDVLARAQTLSAIMKKRGIEAPDAASVEASGGDAASSAAAPLICPLLEEGQCLAQEMRPARCRYWGIELSAELKAALAAETSQLSRKVFALLTGKDLHGNDLYFSLADSVTGKYVQLSFQALSAFKNRPASLHNEHDAHDDAAQSRA